MNEEQIRGYFTFEESDLIANRDGKLSDKQRQRIKEADQFAERLLLALFLIFLAGAVFVGILAFFAWSNFNLWAGMVLLFLVAAWLFQAHRAQMDDTIQRAQGEVDFIRVEKQTGSVNDPSAQRTRVTGYEMRVGDEVFENVGLNPVLVDCMQGRKYAVYFTKTTRHILSVEQITDGQ